MAVNARQSRDDLGTWAKDAGQSDFFALLREIENLDGRRFGRHGGPGNEPARLGQNVRLSFATRDVQRASDGNPPRIDVNVLGLLGPEGPMPLYLTRWVIGRLSNRWFAGDSDGVTSDTAFVDLANTLQHRMIGLYWRAWADARADCHASHGGGPTLAALKCLAGLGLPGTADPAHDAAKLRHAKALARRTRSPEHFTAYVADVVGAPVSLAEFVGHWDPIPEALQSRLGLDFAGLGRDAVLGPRAFSRQGRAEVRVGPLDLRSFVALLDDPQRREALRHAILFAAGHDLSFDVRLVLDRTNVPAARLGDCRLGVTAWVAPRRDRDADDVRLSWRDAA